MLPQYDDDLQQDFTVVSEPTKTFKLDMDKKLITGMVDDLEAVKQAVYCILNTERYEHLIYSWNFGSELRNVIGTQAPLVYMRIQEAITDALIQDDRIAAVTDFEFEQDGKHIMVSFHVETDKGVIAAEKEVII